YELPPPAEFPGEHFTVVAARGGDDVWVEIRRRRVGDDDRVPEEFFAPTTVQGAPGPIAVDAPAPPPAPRVSPMPEPFTPPAVSAAQLPPLAPPSPSLQADADFDDAI